MSDLNVCRVCLDPDTDKDMAKLFANGGKLANELFIVSGVNMVELVDYDVPALICKNCVNELKIAVKFRTRVKGLDKGHFRNLTAEAEEIWNEKLMELKDSTTLIEKPKSAKDIFVKHEVIECDVQVIDEHPEASYKRNKKHSESSAVAIGVTDQHPGSDHEMGFNDFDEGNDAPMDDESDNWPEEDNKEEAVELKVKPTKSVAKPKKSKTWKDLSGPYECRFCRKVITTRKSLRYHEATAHASDREKYACPVCHKKFAAEVAVKRHVRTKHSTSGKQVKERRKQIKEFNAEVPCSVCGKFFKGLSALHQHEKRHIKLEPSEYFYCDLCGNKFKTKSELHSHIKFRHITKRLFHCPHCPEGTSRGWSTKHAMQVHINNVHLGIKEFKCDVCGKEFHGKTYLTRHYRIHTGETPYACRYCDKKFMHQTDRRRHEWTHTGYQGNIKCPNCNQGFVRNSDLQSHLSRCRS